MFVWVYYTGAGTVSDRTQALDQGTWILFFLMLVLNHSFDLTEVRELFLSLCDRSVLKRW